MSLPGLGLEVADLRVWGSGGAPNFQSCMYSPGVMMRLLAEYVRTFLGLLVLLVLLETAVLAMGHGLLYVRALWLLRTWTLRHRLQGSRG